jgi:hypothetical protein
VWRSNRAGAPILGVEPRVFEAPAVEDAVDHHCDPVHPRVVAGAKAVVVDHRPGGVLLQPAINLPDQQSIETDREKRKKLELWRFERRGQQAGYGVVTAGQCPAPIFGRRSMPEP